MLAFALQVSTSANTRVAGGLLTNWPASFKFFYIMWSCTDYKLSKMR